MSIKYTDNNFPLIFPVTRYFQDLKLIDSSIMTNQKNIYKNILILQLAPLIEYFQINQEKISKILPWDQV
jgi:hypothetical protein